MGIDRKSENADIYEKIVVCKCQLIKCGGVCSSSDPDRSTLEGYCVAGGGGAYKGQIDCPVSDVREYVISRRRMLPKDIYEEENL